MSDSVARYGRIIYWSDSDETFIVELPDLPGCMADGPTEIEALANAALVARQWIATARELQRDVPAPRWRPDRA